MKTEKSGKGEQLKMVKVIQLPGVKKVVYTGTPTKKLFLKNGNKN